MSKIVMKNCQFHIRFSTSFPYLLFSYLWHFDTVFGPFYAQLCIFERLQNLKLFVPVTREGFFSNLEKLQIEGK